MIKDYFSIQHLYEFIIEKWPVFHDKDISVYFLMQLSLYGCEEVYRADSSTSNKYTVLFKVSDELEKQIKISDNNLAGKTYKKTLFDICMKELYDILIEGKDKDYEFDYYLDNYEKLKEEFIYMYESKFKPATKKLDTYKNSRITEVVPVGNVKANIVLKKEKRKSSKQDYVKKLENQIAVGDSGQEIVFNYEKLKLADHPDLQEKIEPTYQINDGAGYDIKSFDEFGNTIYIEVKTDAKNKSDEIITFYISEKEDKFISNNSNAYIYYVYNLKAPRLKIISHKKYLELYKKPTEFLVNVICEDL